MRRGDFTVEVIPVNADNIREIDSGHVLARPSAVYAIRLRNLGPLRAVTAIEIDGRRITELPVEFFGLREPVSQSTDASIKRAAGTGLTGHSDQRFVPITLGALENEATVITLRLVIGTEQALGGGVRYRPIAT
ncbi:MAG TPA: hypothetical protein VN600_09415 [Gemmatimonadaceae bacterium]|nr:hypothetical protein [Gemmatimonadaceae bacterium]